jgi:chemotaxis protein methyltransferase CheR
VNCRAFQALIRERAGLAFEGDSEVLLTRAIAARLQALGLREAAYRDRLRVDEGEFYTLISLLTINESYFYREPAHLALLTEQLLPGLLRRRGEPGAGPIRILSVGCATGEEPYSVAIALREHFGTVARDRFEILAGDIDQQALERARQGVYAPFAFRGLPEALQQRYFTSEPPGRFRLRPEILGAVTFLHLNLLADPYPARLQGQDVIFFRNVSIYFDRPLRERIQHRLRALLNPGGHLLVGSTETLANDFGLLTLEAHQGQFHFTRSVAPEPAEGSAAAASPVRPAVRPVLPPLPPPPVAPPSLPSQPALSAAAPPPRLPAAPAVPVALRAAAPFSGGGSAPVPGDSATDLTAIAGLLRDKRQPEALARLAPLLAAPVVPARAWLLQSRALLQLRRFEAADAAACQFLEREPWSAEGHLTRGLIARHAGREEPALEHFRQVVYVQPRHWLAHYHLAELYRTRNHPEAARREYRLVLQQLEDEARARREVAEADLHLAVPPGDLRHLCRRRLASLEGLASGHPVPGG